MDDEEIKQQPGEPLVCEVCYEETDKPLRGCELCGRLFGPCCNSDNNDVCVECI